MRNYNENIILSQARNEDLRATGLHTLLKVMGDISHLFGNEVPYPHSHYYSNTYSRMVYCWCIDGFFGTQKGVSYINDIIARFKITADCQLHSLKASTIENITPIKLKAFQGLKSLAKDKIKDKYKRAETRNDYVFWCLKLYAEDLIRQDGLIIWNTFENWAFDNFIDLAKDKSTLKGKCRNVFNWYFEKDWKIGREKNSLKTGEEIMATRQEHARNMSRNKEIENFNKIRNAITGLMADAMFKKKNGSWNGKAIADYLNIDPRTVNKYLKEI